MMNFAQAYLIKQGKRAYMVHRLDGQTTGALIIAKVPYVVPMLNQLLHDKTIKRTYLAWVDGHLTQPTGTINLPIGEHPTNSRLRQINGINAKPAVTHWTKIKTVINNTSTVTVRNWADPPNSLTYGSNRAPIGRDDLYNPQSNYAGGLLLHFCQCAITDSFSNDIKSIGAHYRLVSR